MRTRRAAQPRGRCYNKQPQQASLRRGPLALGRVGGPRAVHLPNAGLPVGVQPRKVAQVSCQAQQLLLLPLNLRHGEGMRTEANGAKWGGQAQRGKQRERKEA